MSDEGARDAGPLLEATLTRIEASFAAQGLMKTLGARIEHIARARVVIAAPIRPEVAQQMGFAHAGLSFAIGDSAAGYAALSVMDPDTEVVTTEMKIHLLAPATGETLRAEGRVVRAGRRLVVVAADIFALDGAREQHTATLLGTMMPIGP
ncbi:MAG: PaaI family thioesterase [Pseudomonadota bacterium]